jgi:hypothetical protein
LEELAQFLRSGSPRGNARDVCIRADDPHVTNPATNAPEVAAQATS